jgi:N-acetylmuramoyl-L-alanine amidase
MFDIIINLKPLNWAESKEGLNNFFGSAVTNIQNFFITLQKNIMPNAKNVTNICIHCSAGFGDKNSILAFWKSKGWKSVGYHRLIDLNGIVHELADFSSITNGVLGFNDSTIHICYIGGVEKVGDKFKAKDTRSDKQQKGIDYCIQEAIEWLKDNGKDVTKNLGIVGHFDYSKDGNNNGTIEKWERIKECPSFDVIGSDMHFLYSSEDRYNKLPTEK